MDTFLGEVASLLLADHGHDLSAVTVVLPSQRAGLHLRHELARRAGRVLWSPHTTTLNGLCERIGGLRTGNTLDLLFEAHAAYTELEGAEAAALSEFLQWAPTALRDMSEVDAHRLDLDSFYRDLRNWEELDWSFRAEGLSRGQERLLRYWRMKGTLHRTLDERWRGQGHGTAGLVERVAAERVQGALPDAPRIWAVGLNALNTAQLDVLKGLQRQERLVLVWDTDEHYLADADQEAGAALRKVIRELGPGRLPPGRSLRGLDRTITVVHAPTPVSQALFAAARLAELPAEERARTAVVLADEQLLMPLLEALPPMEGLLNVTMGMPLQTLPVGALLQALIELHRDARPGQGPSLAALERLLGHPFIAHGPTGAWARSTLHDLRQERRAQVPFPRLARALATLEEPLRTHGRTVLAGHAGDGRSLGRALLALLAWARDACAGDAFIQEQLFLAAVAQERLDRLLARHLPAIDLRSYAELHGRLLREERLGLFGEPLQGAQVMGMLETRALDPGHIILLSAQEGHLPPATADRSFIPHELRRHHGLPSRHDQEAVSAHHFMRLIQRCPEVSLVCPGSAEEGQSRYIRQLELELVPVSSTTVRHQRPQAPVPHREGGTISVPKDPVILRTLRERTGKGISPSALATYIRCPLDFLLTTLLGVTEREQPGAMIAPDLLGDALHKALEQAFKEVLNTALNATALSGVRSRALAELDHLLRKAFGEAMLAHGQPMLQYAMARKALDAFLMNEEQRLADGAHITVLGLEVPVNVPLAGSIERFGHEVRIKGRIDRVDRRDGLATILDLKTGRVHDDGMDLKELSLEGLRRMKDHHAFQLLTYACAFLESNPDEPAVAAGLLPLQRSSASAGIMLRIEGATRITRADLPRLRALLADVVADLLDPLVPFTHREQSAYCQACIA